ncbi:MAG: glycoside hydrolase family 32 protein [Verrucomicrobiales bacterium]|nr:glycoside hydrolase family 32 protein [Verrucomicrobiales bacterium]
MHSLDSRRTGCFSIGTGSRWLLAVAWVLGGWCRGQAAETASYQEPWRPQFHFTPAKNWMNDPNGMVYHDGEYHLFYQYNPFGDKWGHMSWGHAVSPDLVHWEHLPIALQEENGVMIFSGSAVVDEPNTSGFGTGGRPPLVAIYTGHHTERPLQNQHLAYSNDRGRTWTKYSGNPVLDLGKADFRDPKVFWHAPSDRWIMVVSLPVERRVSLYASPNLREWTHLSDFGPAGALKGIWECPDLFPVRVEGRSARDSRWVLIVNVGSGAPAGGSGCQYFVGTFDGRTFQTDSRTVPDPGFGPAGDSHSLSRGTVEPALWADWGRDFYAAVSWSGVPGRDGRQIWLGWMSNWEYAQDVPTSPWRSAMTVPRDLRLRSTPRGFRLVQEPVPELTRLRRTVDRFRRGTVAEANAWLARRGPFDGPTDLTLTLKRLGTRETTLRILGTAGEVVTLRIVPEMGRLRLDRTRSGRTDFHAQFPGQYEAPVRLDAGTVELRLLIDTSSLEVLAQNGEVSMTTLLFPLATGHFFEIDTGSPEVRVEGLQTAPMRSIWR